MKPDLKPTKLQRQADLARIFLGKAWTIEVFTNWMGTNTVAITNAVSARTVKGFLADGELVMGWEGMAAKIPPYVQRRAAGLLRRVTFTKPPYPLQGISK